MNLPKRFSLMGAAGYVAPRHMRAIRDNGHKLIAAFDPHDNVGVMDSYFPEAKFFTEFERFDREIDKSRRLGQGPDYMSICSPNYLHDAHVRFALRSQAHAVCEKPLVLNPWNVEALQEIEAEGDQRVYTILQLRLHPTIIALKARMEAEAFGTKKDVDLIYITSRGRWYHTSWKGDISKSGGVSTNIGIHFFDMLGFVFGKCQDIRVHAHTDTLAAGFLEFERARVRWLMSIDARDLPVQAVEAGKRTFRSIQVDDTEVEFSEGFTDLHTASYEGILKGEGFGLDQAFTSIDMVHQIRNIVPTGVTDDSHPALARALAWRGETS